MVPDYYELLGVSPDSDSREIAAAVRRMLKTWHPDVNHSPSAHQTTIDLLAAKRILLNQSLRREYDHQRSAVRDQSSPDLQRAEYDAAQDAESSLGELLESLAISIGDAARHAWLGDDFDREGAPRPRSEWFWVGVAGWAFVICLLIPGTSLFTLWIFAFALFPPPRRDFVGFRVVFRGMAKTAVWGIAAGSLSIFVMFNLLCSGLHSPQSRLETHRRISRASPSEATTPLVRPSPMPRPPPPRPRGPRAEGWNTTTTTGRTTWQGTETMCFDGTGFCYHRCISAWHLRNGPSTTDRAADLREWMAELVMAAGGCYSDDVTYLGETEFEMSEGGADQKRHSFTNDTDGAFGACLVQRATAIARPEVSGETFRLTYDCPMD